MAKNKPNQGARKTETLTLRLDPKVKMMIELISRVRRQSITGVIESAIEEIAFNTETPFSVNGETWGSDVSSIMTDVWSTDESERFINLCYHCPALMTFEEQRIWETIKASAVFDGNVEGAAQTAWEIEGLGFLDYLEIRRYWGALLEHVEANKDSRTIVPFEPLA